MPNDFLKDPKVQTLGELQKEKTDNPPRIEELKVRHGVDMESVRELYLTGFRDGFNMAREIIGDVKP